MGHFPNTAALFRRVTEEMRGKGLGAISAFLVGSAEAIGPTLAEAPWPGGATRNRRSPGWLRWSWRRAGSPGSARRSTSAPRCTSRRTSALLSGGGVAHFPHGDSTFGDSPPRVASVVPSVRDLLCAGVTETRIATVAS